MKKRIIWAIILLAIVVPLIIIGQIPFAILIGLVALLVSKELTDLYQIPNVVKILVFLALILITYNNLDGNEIYFGLNFSIISTALLLILIPIIFFHTSGRYTTKDAFEIMGFVLLMGIGLSYLIQIRDYHLTYFLLVVFIPIITDTFAYLGGTLIGKHKVTKISPNKSWEGYIIGSLMGTFMMSTYYLVFINNASNIFLVIGIILLMTIVAQIGDLFFSAIKRQHNIKDFANLIPGHGGIMDRIDSIIFSAVIFIILMQYL